MPSSTPEPRGSAAPNRQRTKPRSGSQPAKRKLVVFKGRQDAPPMELCYRGTPRQEAKLARLEEIRQAREHLGDPTPLPATVQSVFHFDREDQVEALVATRDLEPERAYMPPLLALCSMARTDPGKAERYIRTNGPWSLVMIAGGKKPRLPYGSIPRLLMAWICTEAVQTKSRHLNLGRSLTDFMKEIGLNPAAGGRRGDRTRIQDQLERLLRSSVELSYERDGFVYEVADHITTVRKLWWNPRRADEPVLWNSEIVLGEAFFNDIVARPVPLDFNVLRAMKRSSLGLDAYLWLTYKLHHLEKPDKLSFRRLYGQFAAHPEKTGKFAIRDFRKDLLRELEKLHTAWPEFTYRVLLGHLVLRPTRSRVPARISTEPL